MYAQADLRLCWLLMPHCWKSHVSAHLFWFSLESPSEMLPMRTVTNTFYGDLKIINENKKTIYIIYKKKMTIFS